jgi:hypothetical protein
LIRRQVLRVLIATQLGRELETMLVVLAEPREGVHELPGRGRRADVHPRIATKRDVLHTGEPVGERRVHTHGSTRQIDERRAGEVHAVHTDVGLGQNAEAEVARVAALHAAVVIAAFTAVRGELGGRDAGRILPTPRAIEREVERLTGGRRRRCEVDRAEETCLIAEARAGNAGDGGRNVRMVEDTEETGDRVAGESGSLQSKRVSIEQTVKILGAASRLIRDGEEGLVGLDRSGQQSADGQIAILLAE